MNSATVQESMRARLKASTRELHDRAEEVFAPQVLHGTRATYSDLLRRLLSFHQAIEVRLETIDWADAGIAIEARRKSPWLRSDLRDLGIQPPEPPAALPEGGFSWLQTRLHGLGCMYVLEGSTLGGRFMLSHAGGRLGISESHGGRYLASYGHGVGRMWRSFLSVLNLVDPGSPEAAEVEKSARATFLAVEECALGTSPALCGTHGPVTS